MFKRFFQFETAQRITETARDAYRLQMDTLLADSIVADVAARERRHIEALAATISAGYLSQFGGDQLSTETVSQRAVEVALKIRHLVALAELGAP